MPLIMADGSVLDPNDPKAIEAAVPSTGALILGDMPDLEPMEKSQVGPEPVRTGLALLVGDALEPISAQALVKAADKSMVPAGEEAKNGEPLCKDEPERLAGKPKLFTEGELRERAAQRKPGEAEQALRDQAAKSLTTEGLDDLEDMLVKAGPHKYTSRKRVGDKWVYTYAETGKAKPEVQREAATAPTPPQKEAPLSYEHGETRYFSAGDSYHKMLSGKRIEGPSNALYLRLGSIHPQLRDPARSSLPQRAMAETKTYSGDYTQNDHHTAAAWHHFQADRHDGGEGIRIAHRAMAEAHTKLAAENPIPAFAQKRYDEQKREAKRSAGDAQQLAKKGEYAAAALAASDEVVRWTRVKAETDLPSDVRSKASEMQRAAQDKRAEYWRKADKPSVPASEKPKASAPKADQLALFRSMVPDSLDDFLTKSEMAEEELTMSRVENIAAATSLEDMLEKAGGPYIGPKGGKWADAAHTKPWVESKKVETRAEQSSVKGKLQIMQIEAKHEDSIIHALEAQVALLHKKKNETFTAGVIPPGHPMGKQLDEAVGLLTLMRDHRGEFDTIDEEKPMSKSLEDFLAKAEQTMPEGGPNENLATRHTEDGMGLEGAPKSSGSSDSAASPAIDNPKPSTGKLSEDDAEDERQMKEHQKPIEKGATVVKSLGDSATGYSSEHAAQLTAHGDAVSRSRLAKGVADLMPELGAPQPMEASAQLEKAQQFSTFGGAVQVSNASDLACERLQKSESFWHGEAPGITPAQAPIHQTRQCSCGALYKSYLTACPNCSAGAVVSRVLPVEAGGPLLEKSEGFIGLRPRRQAPDVYIPDGTDSD